MAAEGPRKGEPSTRTMRNGLCAQPALSVRGSSRRIMAMRFRPAHISVINRRASAEAVIGPAVQAKRSKPTSRIMIPLRRPSKLSPCPNGARRQGFASPRQTAGAPLTAARRSGQVVIATGGSGGIMTTTAAKQKTKPGP
jgi:hypothetical protein